MKYVAYYRVSTIRQGQSGLGIEAQKRAVLDTTKNCEDCIIAEFEEHESGKNNDRPKLQAALKICGDTGATLVIAKLDRLSRNAAFILNLMDKSKNAKKPFKILFCDNPNIDETMLGMLAIFAQHERKTMSDRQKASYQSKRLRGLKIGYGEAFTPEIRAKGIAARKENRNNDENVINAKITIRKEVENAQSRNRTIIASDIVAELNRQKIQTYREFDYELKNVRPIIKEVLKEMNLTKLPTAKKEKRPTLPRNANVLPKNDTTTAKNVATKMREKGNSLQQIADKLNELEFKTAKNKDFQATTIMRLIEKA